MNTPIKKCISLLAAAVALVSTPALAGGEYYGGQQQQPTWIVGYSGVDIAKDSHYFYTGALVALNRDLSKSGFVLQAFSGYGSYEYANPSVPGGRVDGDGVQLSAMLGYMFVGQAATLALYAGVDHQNYDLTPNDPSNRVSGSETGVRIGGDLRTTGNYHYASLEGYYSTAFESYWARARVGAKVDRFTFGPEGVMLGSEGYDARRLGGFVMTKLNLSPNVSSELTFNAGYQFVDQGQFSSNGGEGAYGGMNLSFSF